MMTNVKRLIPSATAVLTFMVFWGQIQNYMMRINLSLVIVAMVEEEKEVGLVSQQENVCFNTTEKGLSGVCSEIRFSCFDGKHSYILCETKKPLILLMEKFETI